MHKCPAGAYPLRDFHTICKICSPFQDALAAKFRWICSRGYGVGGFKLTGSGYPKFSAPPNGETMRQTPRRFRGARSSSRSSIIMPSLVGIGFYPLPGRPKTLRFFVCLFVCVSVTLLNVRACAHDFTTKALE